MKIIERVSGKPQRAISQLSNIKRRKILAIAIPSILVFFVLFTPMITFAFSLNPFDYLLGLVAAIFLSLANFLYGAGYAIMSLGMVFSKFLISDSVGSGAMNVLNGNIDVIAYSVFAFTLLITIIATTLGINNKDFAANTMIPKLALTVFLMIFSRQIAAVVYDLAGVLTNTINPDWWNLELQGTAWKTATGGGAMNIITSIFALLVAAVAFIVMLIGFIILMFRAVVIMLLIILAPLAFAMNVLPWTKSVYTQWWSNYTKWVFYLPIFVLIMKIGQIVTNMAATPNPALQIQLTKVMSNVLSLPLPPTGGPTSIGIGNWTNVFATVLDPSGYLLLMAGLIITVAALFYPLSLLGGIAASLGKSAQNTLQKNAGKAAGAAGSSLMNSIPRGKYKDGTAKGSMGERAHRFFGGKKAQDFAASDKGQGFRGAVARSWGAAVGSVTAGSAAEIGERQDKEDAAFRKGNLSETGRAELEKIFVANPDMSAADGIRKLIELAEEEGQKKDASGKSTGKKIFKDIDPKDLSSTDPADAVKKKDAEDRLERRKLTLLGTAEGLKGGGANYKDASRRTYGVDYDEIQAKTVHDRVAEEPVGSKGAKLAKVLMSSGTKEAGAIKFDKIDTSDWNEKDFKDAEEAIAYHSEPGKDDGGNLTKQTDISGDDQKVIDKIYKGAKVNRDGTPATTSPTGTTPAAGGTTPAAGGGTPTVPPVI